MPKLRKAQIDIEDSPYYHCVSRCIRRAFLCGEEHYTGRSYEHCSQWATKTLKQHLLEGYTLNQKRLAENAAELQKAIELTTRVAALPQNKEQGAGLVNIIAKYTNTFLWLQQYDEGLLSDPKGQSDGLLTQLEDAKAALAELKADLITKGEATGLFANERSDGLSSIWGNLEQTVFGE